MSLTKYKQKRHFTSTPESEGKKAGKGKELHFVVQKHAARHLHYDFRLEMEGVLKSWAVPKGPSMNPDDKRLAMEVEDHPFDYKDFEGTIPEGNYGAGNVIVWDNGTYERKKNKEKRIEEKEEKKLPEGLQKGHISFTLHGKKLKGEFSLVKIKNNGQKNAWLLIKKKDEYAAQDDVLKKNKSVLSGVALEDMEEKSRKLEPDSYRVGSRKSGNGRSKLAHRNYQLPLQPANYSPMLALLTPRPFDDSGWLFEIKYDGYRALATIDEKQNVELLSRNRLSFTKKYKPVADDLKKIKHAAVLDGEIVIEDEKKRSHFQLLQQYQKTGKGRLKYYVFDLLNLNGRDITNLTLLQRKELLKSLLAKYKFSHIFYSEHVEEKGKEFYEFAVKNKLEGIIAKKAASQYRPGKRSGEWLKIKITNQEEAVIAGITEPKGSRRHFGSLLLGQYEEGELKYIGNCGTGFTEIILKELFDKFKPHFTGKSPFAEKIKLKNVQWMKPTFVCQVKFTEKTKDGILRHPVFSGLREDKNPEEITPEIFMEQINPKTKNPKPKTKNNYDLKAGKITLHLTNQHKIFFPEDKITKGDLVNYYKELADIILPYMKDRPQSMLRFPNGIHGMNFFQKDVDRDKIPFWLKTKKIYSESNKKYIDYLLCNDKATLIYMANLGCIDMNPWNSTVKNSENPDWMVIDLDPEKIDFKAVVKTARVVKEVIDELEAESFCKTSGRRGLHIYVPLAARYDYEIVKIFAELVAHTVNVRIPEITSIERLPKKRQGKVYVDFLQNRRGQTLAAPYSVRPLPGAPVSTPLEWNEVNEKLSPLNFTMKNIFSRLEKKGDLWKAVLGKGVNIDKILKNMEEHAG